MKTFSKHIVLIGRILVLVLFLTNAGFTAILNNCAMEYADCCETSDSQSHMQCEMPMTPKTGSTSLQSAFQCHTSSVAGGLHETHALIGKPANTQTPVCEIFVMDAEAFKETSAIPPQFQSLTAYTQSVSPPTVEKYVLFATFLI